MPAIVQSSPAPILPETGFLRLADVLKAYAPGISPSPWPWASVPVAIVWKMCVP